MQQSLEAKQPHPLGCILNWFDQLPPDHRSSLACIMVMHLPNISLPQGAFYEDGGAAFLREWLSSDQNNTWLVIGKTLAFRAIVDFTCRKFFIKEGQKLNAIQHEEVRERIAQKGHLELAEKIKHSIEQRPLRDAQWLKAGTAWDQLCSTHISYAALENYERENPPV